MPKINRTVEIDTSDLYKLMDVIESLHTLKAVARDNKMPATVAKAITSIAVVERIEQALSNAMRGVSLQEIAGRL